MGGAYSKHGRGGKCKQKFGRKGRREETPLEDLVIDGITILKCILKKWNGTVWTGFILLSIRSSGVLFVSTVMKLRIASPQTEIRTLDLMNMKQVCYYSCAFFGKEDCINLFPDICDCGNCDIYLNSYIIFHGLIVMTHFKFGHRKALHLSVGSTTVVLLPEGRNS
jgi:hypothetical protein